MPSHAPLTDSAALTGVTVAEAMRPGVIGCPREAVLPMIAGSMVAHEIHAMVVSSLRAETPMVVSDLELVRAAVDGRGETTAGALAREPIAKVSARATLAEAIELMAVRYVSHLLAIEPDSEQPAGILSSLDIAAVIAGTKPELVRMPRPAPARPAPSARTLQEVTVSDVMHAGVVMCTPDTALFTVARMMTDHRVHCVAVVGVDTTGDRGQHFSWSLISDIDLIVALHRDALDADAATSAAGSPVAMQDTESLHRAAHLMLEHDTRHVVAVGRNGLPSGMVSTLDVARVLAAVIG